MNLLVHYITAIHSVKDVTEHFKHATEPMYEVDMTINCFGIVERKKEIFCQSAWEGAKEKGWYLG